MSEPMSESQAPLPLPCPFCGSPAGKVIHHFQPQLQRDGTTYEARSVQCSQIFKGCMGAGPIESSEAKAIAAWNRRESRGELPRSEATAREALAEIVEAYYEWAESDEAPDFDAAVGSPLGRLCDAIQEAGRNMAMTQYHGHDIGESRGSSREEASPADAALLTREFTFHTHSSRNALTMRGRDWLRLLANAEDAELAIPEQFVDRSSGLSPSPEHTEQTNV